MADNPALYGFRYHHTINGGPRPTPIWHHVVTGQSFDVNGGQANAELTKGDVVRLNASGGVEQCDGDEDTAESPYGVVVGVGPYWDGEVMRPTKALPSDVNWGTILARRSMVAVVPVEGVVWEVDVDDATTATTRAAYDLLIMLNVEMVNSGAASQTPARLAPKINISTAATTNTFFWKIIGVSETAKNQDFSGANVKILVQSNNLGQITEVLGI